MTSQLARGESQYNVNNLFKSMGYRHTSQLARWGLGIKKPPGQRGVVIRISGGYYTRPAFFRSLSLNLIALFLSGVFSVIVLPSKRTLTLKEFPS